VKKKNTTYLYFLFIDFEKAYENVNRYKLWEMVDNKLSKHLLNKIKCIYKNTKVRFKFNDDVSDPIHINKGVRQGCGLTGII